MAETKIVSGQAQPGGFSVLGTPLVVDPTFQGARVVVKPDEYQFNGQVGGHYRVAAVTGLVTGAAAGALLFSARWADTKSVMALKRVTIGAVITTAFTAAQAIDFDIIAARAFSAADTGGTAIVLTGNSQKTRSSMSTSLISTSSGDMRVASVGGLTAGTKTLDANAFGIGCVSNANGLGNGGLMTDLYRMDSNGQHPMTFASGEGFNVRIVTAQGAVGVVKYYIGVEWLEALAL